MSFDGIFLHAMIEEIKPLIINGRVSKITQPYEQEIILRIRNNRINYQLLLAANPVSPRIQLTDEKYDNPIKAPQFLMVMRKYLERTTLVDIQQIENDRQVVLTFSGFDELGDATKYFLHLEIMGRHSNLVLLNEDNKVLEVIRHIPPSQNTYRTLLPGVEFKMPPAQDKINPFSTFEWPYEVEPSWKDLQNTFQGLGRDSAIEIIWKMRKSKMSNQEVFVSFIDKHHQLPFQPTISTKNNKQQFSAIPFDHAEGVMTTYQSLSEMLDNYYRNQQRLNLVKQRYFDVSQVVTNEIKKQERKIIKLNKELDSTINKEQYRVKGEVLTAYLHQVEQGMEQITLPNFYENNEDITIDLDPSISPAANAQNLFSTYQKLKNREVFAADQLEKVKSDLDYLQWVDSAIYHAGLDELNEIKEELISEGFFKSTNKKTKKSKKKQNPFEEYEATDGTKIRVGKNNYQNDQLTTKIASRNHWWLHSKDIPGAHVVIVDENPTEQTKLEAAEIAAYYSKYRLSSNVPVDITQVKNVSKPNGARPGFVIYDNQSTLYVTPKEAEVLKRKI